MKIIYPNIIPSVTASSEVSGYPDSNLLTENIGLVWKSIPAEGTPNATIVFSTNVTQNTPLAIGVFGLLDSPGVSIAGIYTYDEVPGTPTITSQTFTLGSYDRVWAEFLPTETGIVQWTVTLSGLSQYQASEIVAGAVITIRDPQYGVSQSRADKSIKQELAGGGYYIHDALKPRTFGLSWVMGRDDEFEALDSLYNIRGSKPLAMLISEGLNNDMKWCGYFHMENAPSATHDMPSYSAVSLSLREAC